MNAGMFDDQFPGVKNFKNKQTFTTLRQSHKSFLLKTEFPGKEIPGFFLV